MRFSHRLSVIAPCTLALALGFSAAPAVAQTGGGANNLVQVFSTADGAFVHRAGVQAATYGGPSAQSTNLAHAEGRGCTGCVTQSAALQAVFLTGDPGTVQVANAAVAVNGSCTQCLTYAYAYQYVITTDRAVTLTPAGQQRIADVERRANAVVAQRSTSLADLAALDEQLAALAGELKSVVDDELRTGGHVAVTRAYHERDAVLG